jgi:tetratricopeptide (TPR) repeat protein
MTDQKIGLLFAQLTEANGRQSVRETVCQTLQQELGDIVEILLWPEAIDVDHGHDVGAALATLATAREWLAEERCDLLVWGGVKRGRLVSLQFTATESSVGAGQCFLPSTAFEIPVGLLSEFRAAIVARTLVSVASTNRIQNDKVTQALRRVADELAETARLSSTSFNAEMRGTLLCVYGDVLKTIGEHSLSSEDLLKAVDIYRDTLNEWTRERFPLRWTATQSKLGNTLLLIGDRESGVDWPKEAVLAHQRALEIRTREHMPLLWALSQHNLGRALCALGERENAAHRFEQAMEAFRESLKEWTRERVPLQWAMVHIDFAVALCALAEREIGVARLQEAVSALDEAREWCTRDGSPRLWASFQHVLGNALRALGERTTGTGRLQEAIATLREAVSYTPHKQFPMAWAGIQHDLGVALLKLGEREDCTQRLSEAVVAFREALSERNVQHSPLQCAITQSRLSDALAALGERQGSVQDLQQAVDGYVAALSVLESAAKARFAEIVRRNLARTESVLNKQRRKELVGISRRPDAALR